VTSGECVAGLIFGTKVAHHVGLSDHVWSVLRNAYVSGIAANLISAVIVAVAAVALYRTSRRRKLRFFGLGEAQALVVYTARLDIPRFGSKGTDGQPRSFVGIAVPEAEVALAARITSFFAAGLPRFFSRGGREQLSWADVGVQVEPAPAYATGVDRDAALFVVGSPAYNAAAENAESMPETIARFTQPNCLTIDHPDQLAFPDEHWAFAQRIVTHSGQVIFYTAGPTIAGTVEAGEFVLGQWRRLARQYGNDRTFCVVLRGGVTTRYRVAHESTP
jgi:hypothetical protein